MVKLLIRRVGVVLALLAIFASYGGHWGALQTAAWSGMLVRYSRDGGLVQGVRDTFDGEHPCALCTQIREARSESESAPVLAVATAHPPLRQYVTSAELLPPPPSNPEFTILAEAIDTEPTLARPPVPPPRRGA